MRSAREVAESVRTVASLPEIYLRLSRVVHDPRSSADDVGRVISEDPALTVRLLRIVNSAVYDFPHRIETVSHALRVVGTLQLLDLSLATAVIRLFRNLPPDLVDMRSFWKHSIACGIGARIVGQWLRQTNTERLFVAGILHDIGRPVLYTEEPDASKEALLRSHRTGMLLTEVEREVMGFTHCEVGMALLQEWGLSDCLQEVVLQHHEPAGARQYGIEAATVHLADIFVNALGYGTSGEQLVPPLAVPGWESLGLPLDAVPAILARLDLEYGTIVSEILVEEAA